MKVWDDRAWQRHLELTKLCYQSGFEAEWGFYVDTNRGEHVFAKVSRRVYFVHSATGIEFSQVLSPENIRTLFYANTLIRNMSFINWLGDL